MYRKIIILSTLKYVLNRCLKTFDYHLFQYNSDNQYFNEHIKHCDDCNSFYLDSSFHHNVSKDYCPSCKSYSLSIFDLEEQDIQSDISPYSNEFLCLN